MSNAYWSPNGAKMSPLTPWDKSKNIYYVEISFPDQKLYGKSYSQFFIANYNGASWNGLNDYSRQGLNEETFTITENIPVYKDGVLVFGKEPGGTVSTPTPTPSASKGYKISGFISPDMNMGSGNADKLRSGFKVEVTGTSLSAITDKTGYFEIADVPQNAAAIH
jgi:hypothetical protein